MQHRTIVLQTLWRNPVLETDPAGTGESIRPGDDGEHTLCNVAHLIRRATVHCARGNKQHPPPQRGNNLPDKPIRTTETWFSS